MRSDPFKFTSSLDTSGVRIPPGWVPYPDELTWAERLRQWWRRWRGISGRSLPRMNVDAPMPGVKPPRPNSKWGRSVPAPPTFVTPVDGSPRTSNIKRDENGKPLPPPNRRFRW